MKEFYKKYKLFIFTIIVLISIIPLTITIVLVKEKFPSEEIKSDNFSISNNSNNNIVSVWNYKYNTKIIWNLIVSEPVKHTSLFIKENESYCYDNNELNCERYSRLYNFNWAWYPCLELWSWWRLPNDQDYKTLISNWVTGYKWNKLLWLIKNIPWKCWGKTKICDYKDQENISNWKSWLEFWSSTEDSYTTIVTYSLDNQDVKRNIIWTNTLYLPVFCVKDI